MTTQTIFIIDDDEAVRDSFAAFLEAAGFQTQSFGSGEDFLTAHDGQRRGCLLLDIHLPGMSGLDLLERLLLDGRQLPTVVITARGDHKTVARATSAGALAVFDKPVDWSALLQVIRGALGEAKA